MFSQITGVKIAGIRAAAPAQEISIEDEAQYHGGKKKIARLRAAIGMDRRRVCPPDVTASDLCAFAAENLFQDFPDIKEKIDLLVFVSQSPDWFQPATACELQNRLELPRSCAAFDVNQGCAGYIYGLWLASSLLSAGSLNNALLLVGDVNARGRDVRNRITAPVFGDGGSATLLSRDMGADPLNFSFGTDGSGFEMIIVPGGQSRIPYSRDPQENMALVEDFMDPGGNPWTMVDTYMDGGAVFNFTMDVVSDHIQKLLVKTGKTPDDINWLILHQANRHIVRTLAEKAGFPLSKTPDESFGLYGNLASASLPVALCSAFSHNQNPGSTLMCGYGIGLSWGSCLCNLKSLNCAPVLDFEADPARLTRQQRIERWQKIFRGEQTINE